ncbi:hypothetical protein QOZ80_3BG0283610 [Eleusine coracana subsp. coracana]|nr:hypothetical protein QOZ80_3BG0283610 [Eleusine coracana subsp. coracana]
MASSSAATDPLVHVAFNSDATHFVAASSSGIRVFSCNPLEHVFSRSGFAFPDGSGSAGEVTAADVALPLVAAVVFGDTIRYWSERHGQMMSEAAMALTVHGVVRAVRHVGNLVVVAGEDRVTLHETSLLLHGVVKRVMEVETGPNPWGACALAQTTTTDGGNSFVLACPSLVGGDVQIWHGADKEGRRVDVRTRSGERDVACLELSRDARLLCSTDSWGRVLCIFSTADGMILQQLRRCGGIVEICCIAFSPNSKWLAVSNDQGVNLFRVRVDLIPWTVPNDLLEASDELMDSYIRAYIITSFMAEMPVATFRLVPGVRYVAAFGQEPNTIQLISMLGSFYRCQFDPMRGRRNRLNT